jgi:DNA mismatch repair protein MutL
MSIRIRLLPENVANQIAAGEVVQRPASVVKELLENSVDAGASRIDLIIKDAGRTLIQVIDDGSGMGKEDALLAFERHATSKIKTAHDLFDLHTNGFRGEALASIAAVSHVRLKTRTEEEELGTEIRIDGGTLVLNNPVQTSKGSVFEVRNLFYNIPARRNFLKGNSVETRHIVEAFQRVAFTYPDIQFRLVHNDSELFNLPAATGDNDSAKLRQRIIGIMGRNTNEKLVPIQEDTEMLRIRGFVGKPSYSRKKRGEQFFFVNKRFIRHSYLHHAVQSAFEGLVPAGNHPAYYLFLEVPRKSLDVNIHPTKTEVKFDNERDLYAIIRSTIKHSLGQYNVVPSLDFDRDASLDTPYAYKDRDRVESPSIEVNKDFNPFKKDYA